MIIIPTKWLFHWGYSPFSDTPICQEQERAKESDATRQGCQEIFCSTRSWSSAHPFCGHFFLYTSQKNQSLKYTANLTGDIPFLESGVELPTCEVGSNTVTGL